jgi:YggT family protein
MYMIDREQVVQEDVVQTPAGKQVRSESHSTTMVPSERDTRLASLQRIKQIIYFIVTAIAVIIVLRFVLLMLAANPDNTFANFIYGLSGIFVAPFNSLFGEPQFGNSVFEVSSLVAIAVYYMLAWGISKIVTLTTAPPDPTGTTYE